MSYPVPTLYASKSNAQGTPGLENPQYWGDIDANYTSGAIVTVVGDINVMSASVAYLTSTSLTPVGGILTVHGELDVTASNNFPKVKVLGSSNATASLGLFDAGSGDTYATVGGHGSHSLGAVSFDLMAGLNTNYTQASAVSLVASGAALVLSASSGVRSSGSFEVTGTAATTLYLHSPDGARWAINIDNAGVLSSTLA